MAFNILAGTQYVQQQGEEGRQRGQGQFAAKLLGEAYNSTGAARQDALGRLAGRQPQVAMAADQQFRQQDAQMTEEAFARLQTHAKMIQSVPAEQRANVWAQIQPRIAQELPEYAQYLPSQWDEAAVMPVVEQLANLDGGGPEQKVLSPGAAVWDGKQVVYTNPALPSYSAQQIGDGLGGTNLGFVNSRDPSDVRFPFGGPQAAPANAPAAGGPAAAPVNLDFADLVGDGVVMTSWRRTADKNSDVGGKPNSQHLSGNGADFVVPASGKAAFRAKAEAAGFQVLDEGDHMHVQRPRGGAGGAPAGGPSARPGYTPPKGSDTEMDRRIELARSLGASDEDVRRMVLGRDAAAGGSKPMPASVLKMRETTLAEAETANTINMSIDKHLGRIESGSLDFSMTGNLANQARNFTGRSTEESRNFAEFKADLEKLRNDSLRLNAGVQTDGDAKRAWDELIANINDAEYVKQRLETIRGLNERASLLKQESVERIDAEYGKGEPPVSGGQGGGPTTRLRYNPATGDFE